MALSTTEILKTLKEKFNALIAPVAAPAAPAAPVAPVAAAAPAEYTLQDGTTKVSITDLNPGGIMTIAAAPAPAGTYTLQDGTVVIVAENGTISTVTPIAAPAAPAAPAGMAAAFAGGIEERLAACEDKLANIIQSMMSWELAEQARQKLVEGMDTMAAEMAAQKEVTGTMLQLVEILATEPAADEDPAKTSKTILKPADVSKEQFATALFSKKIKTA
jgi:hypothetical protein